jgi:hypothetical protein
MGVLFETGLERIHRSAEISECGRYRWWLRRSWNLPWNPHSAGPPKSKGAVCFVMLNPSTADGTQDDPTIRRCIRFAHDWGYDTLSVRNLFPFRATDPKELVKAGVTRGRDFVTAGHAGDTELLAGCTANLLVAAWGAGAPFGRDEEVLSMFRIHFAGVPIYCLGTTKGGHPRHPLYVRADTQPVLLK